MLARAGRLLRAIGRIELVVAVAAFLATCGVVGANALLRFAFNDSLIWAEEVALLATNVFVFVGAAVIMKARADIAVSLVLESLPTRPRALVQLVLLTAAALFFACLLAASISLWPLQRNATTFILDIGRYWFTLPLAWAALSMLATTAYQASVVLCYGEAAGEHLRLLTLPDEPA